MSQAEDDWSTKDIAYVDEQIRLIQSAVDAGDTTLTVDLRKYLSLHRYLRDVLDLCSTYRRQMMVHALLDWKRPVGRPRKAKSGSPPKSSKGGRPAKYSEKVLQEMNEHVESKVREGRRLGIKTALGQVIDDLVGAREPDTRKRERGVQRLVGVWYKPLMKYRSRAGLRLRQKSQNPSEILPIL